MQQRKKVLFFAPGGVGGAERVTLTIAKMLPQQEYEVKIILVCKEVGDLTKFIPDYMSVKHLRVRNIWDFVTLRIYKILKKEKPYAVFCSLRYLNCRVLRAAHWTGGIKTIVRNEVMGGKLRWDSYIRLRNTYKYADHVIMQSSEMMDNFVNFMPSLKERLKVISNPIDTDTINVKIANSSNPFTKSNTNFVYSGRISKEKGLDILISAFAKVKKHIKNAKLTIVGNYKANLEYYKMLHSIIDSYDLDEYIDFVGFQDNPYKYVKYADCFVLTSYKEGCPNVLLEAMYLQVPVIATRSVPIVDRIVEQSRGYVVNVGDAEAISSKMIDAVKLRITEPYSYDNRQEFIDLF